MSTAEDYDQEKAFNEELAKINDESIKEKLKKIKDLVVKRILLEREFKTQECLLEAKYEKKYAEFYNERSQIVKGEKNVTVDDAKEASIFKDVKIADNFENKEKGIPEFWLTCLKNSNQFGELISKKDEEILKHLEDITIDYKENGDFSLFFHFSQNTFFDQTVLHRHFFLDEKKIIKKIESSEINWSSEKANPTVTKTVKKLKNKSKPSATKTVEKLEEVSSFFNFFKNYTATDPNLKDETANKKKPSEDEEEDEELDPNDLIEEQYELGIFFKDEIIPYSLEYYLGLVDDEDDDDMEMEEDEDEEDDKPKKKTILSKIKEIDR